MSTTTFQEQLWKVEENALMFIIDKLNETNEIVFYDESEDRYDEEDELHQMPTQIWIGKHYSVYFYHIIKIYKKDDKYFAKGLDDDELPSYFDFNFDNLDTTIIVQIADKLNENTTANITELLK